MKIDDDPLRRTVDRHAADRPAQVERARRDVDAAAVRAQLPAPLLPAVAVFGDAAVGMDEVPKRRRVLLPGPLVGDEEPGKQPVAALEDGGEVPQFAGVWCR